MFGGASGAGTRFFLIMNATGIHHLSDARSGLQSAAKLIAQATREGEPNSTDERLLTRLGEDVALQIAILDVRLGDA